MIPEHEQVFVYTRTLNTTTVLVLLNFSPDEVEFSVRDAPQVVGAHLLLGNYMGADDTFDETVRLRGYEGRVYKK